MKGNKDRGEQARAKPRAENYKNTKTKLKKPRDNRQEHEGHRRHWTERHYKIDEQMESN